LHATDNDKEVTFSVPSIETHGIKNHLGSLNRTNIEKYNYDITDIKVNTTTYNKIINDNNITDLDLFVLDIEGYETEFLQTFSDWGVYPRILVIEIGHYDKDDIITNLIKEKYYFYSRLFVNNIYVRR
jgi:FkbM family methyltransferase